MVSRPLKITEVAAEAGVGVATVSRVINDRAGVSGETRRRVMAVVDRLGYRPSRLAAGLALGTTRSVAVLVPFLARPSVVARLASVLPVLEEAGLDCVVCNIETPEQRDRHLRAFADHHRVAGILVVSVPLDAPHIAAVRSSGVPLILVDVDGAGVPRVVVDDVAGGRLAAEHVLGLGHDRIAFIGDATGPGLRFRSTRRRMVGIRSAMSERGATMDASLVRLGPHGAAPAMEMAVDLLGGRDPPTAVLTASDTQAMGVLWAAAKLGLQVPGDLSVVGFDDVEVAEILELSTVRQPLARSGEAGAQLLIAAIRGESVPTRRLLLPLELVVRRSCAPPRSAAINRSGDPSPHTRKPKP